MRLRTRLGILTAVTAVFSIGGGCREPISHESPQTVAPALASLIGATAAGDQVFVVVQYDEAATTGDAVATGIMGLGAGARALRQLPFVGALATPAQVNAIAALPGVVRVSENRRLAWLGMGSPAPLLALL